MKVVTVSTPLRISIDTGGTFTDVTAIHSETGAVHVVKTPSDRKDPSAAFLAGVEKVLAKAGGHYDDVEMVIHGTTTATNAVLEHEFDGIGLLVTQGFRHVVEIARQSVPDGYGNSYFWVKPPRLVPLHLVREIPERMLFDGGVHLDLDEAAVISAVEELVEQGVTRLAVCLLHSYANDSHETRIAEIVESRWPDLFLSLSSVVLPEYREYERTMTTLIDVMVKPYCKTYLERAEEGLVASAAGRELPFLIMQSNGGVVSARAAGEKPVTMLLSGPAGGVLGAIETARQAGFKDILTLDVGGTSTDVCLIENLELRLTSYSEIEHYPVKTPMIDIATVGTGGGSLAWVGPQGALKVGPRSAGAFPGPACYGRGGSEPTITDAAAILGRLPDSLVGGELVLDKPAAREVFSAFGKNFGLDPEEAAAGVLEVGVAGQVHGIRQVTTTKGRDPADYTLVAFGGAGPLLADEVAAFLGIKTVLIAPNPGNLSAFGLQVTDIRRDYVRTLVRNLSLDDHEEIIAAWDELKRAGLEELQHAGVVGENVQLVLSADLRYLGEGYEVTAVLPDGVDDAQLVKEAEIAFHAEHDKIFGFSYPEEQPVEIINLRVQAVGKLHRPRIQTLPAGSTPDPTSRRPVYWRQSGWVDCAIYDRESMGAGSSINGPAVIEEYGSTVVVSTGWSADVDNYGNLILKDQS